MAKNKKPRKPYVPNHVKAARIDAAYHGQVAAAKRAHYIREFAKMGEPMTERRLDYAFKPLEDAVDDIERTGECYTDEKGSAIFMPDDEEGIWYPLADSIHGACNVFARLGGEDAVAGLRRLAKRLELCMPIFAEDTAAARESFKGMRAIAAKMTPRELIATLNRVADESSQSNSAQ